MAKYTEDDLREDPKTKEYEAGFYTDIEYEDFSRWFERGNCSYDFY